MKKNYLNWNKSNVSDQTILNDLRSMCPKDIDISNEIILAASNDLINTPPKTEFRSGSKNGGRSSQRNKNRKLNNNNKK
jgi:hypothetical protein